MRRLVDLMELRPDEPVLEPGPGHGMITEELARRGLRVMAVEKDVRLYRALRERLIGRTNVECHLGDVLTMALPQGRYAVVSSVPYGITAALVRRLLEARTPPERAYLIVQREAAEKFAGAPRETLFSLLHKPWFALEIVASLRRTDFAPPPSVESALLRIERRGVPLVEGSSQAAYQAFVRRTFGRGPDAGRSLRACFTSRQVARLARELGFSMRARPSELTFGQWLSLWRFFEHECLPRSDDGGGRGRLEDGRWRLEAVWSLEVGGWRGPVICRLEAAGDASGRDLVRGGG